jgi:hypothetical protein
MIHSRRSPNPTAARAAVLALATLGLASGSATGEPAAYWWAPGEPRTLAPDSRYGNEAGEVGVHLEGGAELTIDHPFFVPLGANGRACVSCHQPQDGMSIALASIRERWRVTNGRDPLFAMVDGADCPHLPPGDPASHSLLLGRGLIRVAMPWPPRDAQGKVIEPQFSLEVVRDPTGCNTHPDYGLKSATPQVSVYRRPRPVANTKYTTHQGFGVTPFIGKSGMPTARDPETGRFVSMNLMADARVPTLALQAADAARGHLERSEPLTDAQLRGILDLESRLYVAQVAHRSAGALDEPGGPTGLGPLSLVRGEAGVLGNNTARWVIPMEDKWKALPRSGDAAADARAAARESIQRGHDIYMFRTFWIRDSMHLNNVGLGNPTKRTCATCHGMHMTGMDTANGWMDIGTTNLPWAREEPLNPWNPRQERMPLFKVTCRDDVNPHPFLGRVIYTQDPGRALVTGQCNDVGAIVMQQLRGLAARPPYFSNGVAADLREVVDLYDRRYNIGYTEQEKVDLIHFMEAL